MMSTSIRLGSARTDVGGIAAFSIHSGVSEILYGRIERDN
jgi:hypothetical protein